MDNHQELRRLRTAILAKAEEHRKAAMACENLAGKIIKLMMETELAEDAARVLLNKSYLWKDQSFESFFPRIDYTSKNGFYHTR